MLSRERSLEHSLVILSCLLKNAWELYRREWNRVVERNIAHVIQNINN